MKNIEKCPALQAYLIKDLERVLGREIVSGDFAVGHIRFAEEKDSVSMTICDPLLGEVEAGAERERRRLNAMGDDADV